MLEVENIDKPGGDLEIGNEDNRGKDMKIKKRILRLCRKDGSDSTELILSTLFLLRGNSLQTERFSSGNGVGTPLGLVIKRRCSITNHYLAESVSRRNRRTRPLSYTVLGNRQSLGALLLFLVSRAQFFG